MPLLKIAKHQPHSQKENLLYGIDFPFAMSVHMGRATTVKIPQEEEILDSHPKLTQIHRTVLFNINRQNDRPMLRPVKNQTM